MMERMDDLPEPLLPMSRTFLFFFLKSMTLLSWDRISYLGKWCPHATDEESEARYSRPSCLLNLRSYNPGSRRNPKEQDSWHMFKPRVVAEKISSACPAT